MFQTLVLLCVAITSTTYSAKIPAVELQPPETDSPQATGLETKTNVKRHAPWLGFIPIVYLPPVVEVRYVINVQAPDARCFPSSTPSSTTTTPTPDGPDLTSRFGNTTSPTTTTSRPTAETGPSRCVWAIVACCSPGSTQIRYPCFELLGCQGAFWDTNPCEPSVVQAAANTALQFYMSNMNANETNTIEPDNL